MLTRTTVAQPEITFETYSDSQFGFQIDYPSGWEIKPYNDYYGFVATEPRQDSADAYSEGFNLHVYPTTGMALEEWVQQQVAGVKQYYGDVQVKQTRLTTKNGLDCIVTTFDLESEGLMLYTHLSFFDNGSQACIITQDCETSKKLDYDPVFRNVVESFKWVSD